MMARTETPTLNPVGWAVFVELTRYCDLKCPMCRPVGHRRWKGVHMSDETFDRVRGEVLHSARFVSLRGWGESTILPSFPKRVKQVAMAGAMVKVTTNLHSTPEASLEALAEANAQVGVSLDSANPALLRKIRGGARMDRIVDNIRRLFQRYKAFGGTPGRIYLSVTVSAWNADGLYDLVKLAASLGIVEVRLFPVRGSALGAATELEAQFSAITAFSERHGIDVQVGARLCPEMRIESPFPNGCCIHPFQYLVVHYDGKLGFCDQVMGPADQCFVVGDLMTESLDDVYQGKAWIHARGHHAGGRKSPWPGDKVCAWCYAHRFIDDEPLLDPDLARRVIRVRDVWFDHAAVAQAEAW